MIKSETYLIHVTCDKIDPGLIYPLTMNPQLLSFLAYVT